MNNIKGEGRGEEGGLKERVSLLLFFPSEREGLERGVYLRGGLNRGFTVKLAPHGNRLLPVYSPYVFNEWNVTYAIITGADRGIFV